MMMLPFESWDGKNDLSGTVEQAKLEQHFGPAAVVFGSYQAAISAILEILGARSHIIPVIMPITASPDTIAGVLRAGAEPFLLDIHPQTLQMDPDALTTVLTELGGAVVLLTRPGGQSVDQELLARVGDNPTILDSRLCPQPIIDQADLGCTFNVFDFGPLIGSGALVIHQYAEQVRELRMARSGLLGLAANMNDVLAAGARKRLQPDAYSARVADRANVVEQYQQRLGQQVWFKESPHWPYLVVEVENADKVVAHLHTNGIEVVKPVFPLHLLDNIGRRWVETPSYPVAESLWKKLVALPVHTGILGNTGIIVDTLLEVA